MGLPGPVERSDHISLCVSTASAGLHNTYASAIQTLTQLPWSQVISTSVFIHSASLQSQRKDMTETLSAFDRWQRCSHGKLFVSCPKMLKYAMN